MLGCGEARNFQIKFMKAASIVLTIVTVAFCWETTHAMAQTNDSTVLITGSNRGIGLAFAQAYAEAGWNVIATSRSPENAEDLKTLAAAHSKVAIEELDVTDEAEIAALADKYQGTSIDILINNAGILPTLTRVTFDTIDYEKMDRMLAVNTWGPMKVSAALIDNVAASTEKKIITITSGEGSIGGLRGPGAHHYRTTKVAINMLMHMMALEVDDRGVVVGLINPGLVDTQGLKEIDLETIPEAMRGPVKSMANHPNMRSPKEAVDKLIPLINSLTLETSGSFYDISGEVLPW